MASALSCAVAAQKAITAAGPLAGMAYNKAVHAARVKTSYRIALKTALSDYGPLHKTEFWEKMQLVDDVRYLFERNRDVTDLGQIDQMIDKVYETIKNDVGLANSKRRHPPMDPGGTSWQRNIPVAVEIANQHEETDNEILDSWDRFHALEQKWKEQDFQDSPTGDILFEDEAGWAEMTPKLAETVSALIGKVEKQLSEPVLNRFQAMEQNIRLQIAVHNFIPKSETLQNEIGDGPLPFVQYAKALRSIRNLVQARKSDSSPAAQWDARATFRSLPEAEVDIQALVEGRLDTPEDAALWAKEDAFAILGAVPDFAGPVEQQALRELKLSHLEPDSVEDWVQQSVRLHILVSAVHSPFEAIHREFEGAQPDTVRPLAELVAEAEAMRHSIVEQGEDLFMDAKAAEIRKAFQEDRFLRGRLRVRDLITFRGTLLSPYEEYLVLHYTVRFAELVQGRAFKSEFASMPVITAIQANPVTTRTEVHEMAESTGDISPLPIPNTPSTTFSVFLDFMRLRSVQEKLRKETVYIAARHKDTNWLLQNEEARVKRLREVREARAANPAYAKLFGADAPQKALQYHPAPESFLNPVPANLLVQNQIVGGISTQHWLVDHVLPENSVKMGNKEGIDDILFERDEHLIWLAEIRRDLDAMDTTSKDYAVYERVHTMLQALRRIERACEMGKLRLDYPRREMLEGISKQVDDLNPSMFA